MSGDLYYDKITGIDYATLLIHKSHANSRYDQYTKKANKLHELQENQNRVLKEYIDEIKEIWEKSYKSESGNVEKTINIKIQNLIEGMRDYVEALTVSEEGYRERAKFYGDLAQNCHNICVELTNMRLYGK